MKTLVLLLIASALLAGCAASAPQAALQGPPDATQSRAKIELFYNEEDQFTVADGGGSGMVGFAGLLGPVGTLVALGVEVGSRATLADRKERRSKEFAAAVNNGSTATSSLSRQFAEQFAARLRESGREVKLTPAFRVNGPVAEMQALGHRTTPGYGSLTMRITAAYSAPDAPRASSLSSRSSRCCGTSSSRSCTRRPTPPTWRSPPTSCMTACSRTPRGPGRD